MNKNTPLWNDELYELLEFLFWEPQHLGKIKNKKSSYHDWDDVVEHLEKIEVLLNHHFSLFFNLSSGEQKNLILSDLLGVSLQDNFSISSTSTRKFETIIENYTQPDLLFEGAESMVYIEMKIGAKCNLEQLLKYLILHILYEEKTGKSKTLYLLFLGIGDIKGFFQEKAESVEELKRKFREHEFSTKIPRKGKLNVRLYIDRAEKLLENIHISYINYTDFANSLKKQLKTLKTETEQKLFQGLILELEKRNLIS